MTRVTSEEEEREGEGEGGGEGKGEKEGEKGEEGKGEGEKMEEGEGGEKGKEERGKKRKRVQLCGEDTELRVVEGMLTHTHTRTSILSTCVQYTIIIVCMFNIKSDFLCVALVFVFVHVFLQCCVCMCTHNCVVHTY